MPGRRRSCSITLPTWAAALIVAAGAASPATAAVQTFSVDSTHTVVRFDVRFLGLVDVEGRFGRCGGELRWDAEDPRNSSVEFALDTASLDTGFAARDKHLRSDDFFAAETYPEIRFKSRSIAKGATGEGWVASGDLTLHGVTREMQIPFTMTAPLTFPSWDKFKIGCNGRAEIDRLAYGIGTKPRFMEMEPNGARWAADIVPVEFHITWDRSKIAIRPILAATIGSKGVEAAVRQYHEIAAGPTAGEHNLSEREINLLGYDLLGQERTRDAIRIFELNVAEHPQSANAYDSLGEALMKKGDRDRAIASYRKSLELNPENKNATEMLAKLAGS